MFLFSRSRSRIGKRARENTGAAGTLLGTGAGIAGTALAAHGVAKGIGYGANLAGRALGHVSPGAILEPQLDASEASAVQYGREQGVQMPASVQSGSPSVAHAEKVLQHFPLASKVAKTARAAEQSTLAAAGARELEGLGAPGAAVPSPLEVGEAVHAKVDQTIAAHHAAGDRLAGPGGAPAPAALDVGKGSTEPRKLTSRLTARRRITRMIFSLDRVATGI
jgi:hypothetical protein